MTKPFKGAILPHQTSPGEGALLGPTPTLPAHVRLDDGSLLYELVVSRKLPTVNLSNTLLSKFGSVRAQELLTQLMRKRYRALVSLHRIASLGFFGMIFTEDEALRAGFACVCSLGVFPVVTMMLFLSTDIVRLLSRNYEFWFITVLNTVHWSCVALILRDARIVVCFSFWLSLQTVVMIDANFRTFPAATRSVIAALPAMVAIGICCAFREIRAAHFAPISVFTVKVSPPDVVVFTTSTLVVFMAKKIYFKRTRRHQVFAGYQSIPCVVLRATLKYSVTHQIQRRVASATAAPIEQLRLQQLEQTLRSSSGSLINLRAKRIFAPLKFFYEPWRLWWLRLLYLIGIVGLACTSVAWVLSLKSKSSSSHLPALSIAGAACTFVFVMTFGCMLHHDLMWSMAFNFDYMFSVAQVYILTFCLTSMLQWDAHKSLAVFSWFVWFQWVLFQDGFSPTVKRRLRYRKWFAAPVIVMILLSLVPLLFRILDGGDLLVDSVIVDVQLSASLDYKLHVKAVALQRIVTILCWSARLVHGFVSTMEDELLFIRGPVEYLSPCDVFPG